MEVREKRVGSFDGRSQVIEFNAGPEGSPQVSFKRLVSDPTVYSLVVSNLLIIAFVLKDGWSIRSIIGIYWLQGLIIGIFRFFRILSLGDYSTEGLLVNGKSVDPTQKNKLRLAFSFARIYFFTHLVIGFFLSILILSADPDELLTGGLIFAVNHFISFVYHVKDFKDKPNIGLLVFSPLTRVWPMALIIFLGVVAVLIFRSIASFFVLFLILKTIADVYSHVIEHS